MDDLVRPEINNAWLMKIWTWFLNGRAKQIIINKPDEELKIKAKEAFDLMKPIFGDIDLASEINESSSLNSGKGHEFVKKINKDVLDLIP